MSIIKKLAAQRKEIEKTIAIINKLQEEQEKLSLLSSEQIREAIRINEIKSNEEKYKDSNLN